MNFPTSLGLIGPGASFATLSAALTMNIQPVANDGVTPDNQFNGIWIQALKGNAADIYVCNSAAAPDVATYTNVIAILSPGEWLPRVKEWSNTRDISKLFVGALNATDFAIASIDAF
jgi:hypothetical protein